MEAIIEFKDFSFTYKSQEEPTLNDINLKIYPGEKVLIAGPSGCGKSTLAHCINGLVPFSYPGTIKGSLKIKGLETKEQSVFKLSKIVGTVLQDTDGQFIGLTVGEDIAFALENDRVPVTDIHKKVNEVSDLLELTPYLSRNPGDLSGGQKQRVSMAGVMVDDVEILLFDEPLANLDPATGKSTIERIDEINRSLNTTTIIVEHRVEDVLYKSVDRMIIMNDGRIVADDTPDNILSTDILSDNGIREPLYIAAIKHAGAKITPQSHPSDIKTMDLSPYKSRIKSWYTACRRPYVEKNKTEQLQIKNLSFSYNKNTPVLHDINVTVHEGEMISIVGKNGAGKTTLSSLICGFYKPDKGDICMNGESILGLSIKERGEIIGLGMQNPNQMICKPMIYDEVALALASRNVAEAEIKERVHNALRICGLYQMRNWPVSALSFGQKKRLTIASTLCTDPKLLILDEPTAGQDYKHYTEFMDFLRALNREKNITIIMITHDMHLMLEYTDRAIAFCDGKIICDDSPARVLTNVEIAKQAYLKETSLYDLAQKCDIADPSDFADMFIRWEEAKNE